MQRARCTLRLSSVWRKLKDWRCKEAVVCRQKPNGDDRHAAAWPGRVVSCVQPLCSTTEARTLREPFLAAQRSLARELPTMVQHLV
jgi:hypothetical protein